MHLGCAQINLHVFRLPSTQNRHNSLFNAAGTDGTTGGKDQVAGANRQKGKGSGRVVDK